MVFDKMPKWSEIWLLCFLIWEFMNFVLIVTWVDTLCGDFWVVGISDILLIFFKSFWLAILTIGVVMCFLQFFFYWIVILKITKGTAGGCCYEWPPILSRYSKSSCLLCFWFREWVESDTTFVDAPNKAEKFAQRSFTLPFTFYCYLYNKLKASYVLNVILSKSDFVLASQLRNYNFIHYDKIIWCKDCVVWRL